MMQHSVPVRMESRGLREVSVWSAEWNEDEVEVDCESIIGKLRHYDVVNVNGEAGDRFVLKYLQSR